MSERSIAYTSPFFKPSIASPLVKITPRILEKIAVHALQYPHLETGEALVGLAMQQPTKLLKQWVILETIPSTEAVRNWGQVELGDTWQHAVFEWWHANWQYYRRRKQAFSEKNIISTQWDFPLAYLGDWHKQPGLVRPSQGDMKTAQRLLRQNHLDYLLLPIVNFASQAEQVPSYNTLSIHYQEQNLRIDFWGIFSDRPNHFEALAVEVIDDANVPRLPPIAWYLENTARYDKELLMLEYHNISVVDITPWGTRAHPPLDIGWILHPTGAHYIIIVLTPTAYPHRQPQWRIAPLIRPSGDEDFFAMCYNASSPVQTLIDWHHQMYLIDGVKKIQEYYSS
ncbi:MAG: hypothetical protein CUN55_00685 [Phototrophicales bacterium]|nr:MAG: hypothetical protein CUN55_00685 [Phototrophicales bacterium]